MTYVLPLRRSQPDNDGELGRYVQWLSARLPTIVVDGSAPEVFAAHNVSFGASVTHVPVDPDLAAGNGKVSGVLTGLRLAASDKVVIADDDVRYDDAGLRRMADLLGQAELVRPQNHFSPLPWHARWDSARTLINRAFGADYPGTLGVRRHLLLATGGYDGDCLFENLELIRTVEAAGGRVLHLPDFYVRRLPPTSHHFWSQRVRQAYDSFAQPGRLAAELALAPTLVLVARRCRPRALLWLAGTSVAVAEAGRRRARGTAVFPPTASWFAPLWLAERAVCSWLAVWQRVRRGGMPYGGAVLRRAANSSRELRRRHGPGVGTSQRGHSSPMSDYSENDIDEPAGDEEANAEGGIMSRLVDGARGSGVGTEDPNIVGDVGPTDVPPGQDPEPTILPGVVAEDADSATPSRD